MTTNDTGIVYDISPWQKSESHETTAARLAWSGKALADIVAVKGTIYVRRSNQKGIVLGEKGRTLRTARRQSEAELRELFDAPVECDLWIRVEPNWDENFFLLRQIGYC